MPGIVNNTAEKSDHLCYREADQSMKDSLTTGNIDDFRRWCRAHPDMLVGALDWIYSHHHVHREIVELELREVRHRKVIERLEAIEKPHWTMTPVFWLTLATMLAAIAAAIFAYPAWHEWISESAPPSSGVQSTSPVPVSPKSSSSTPPQGTTPSGPTE
jgi:hypothetical protein